MVRDDLLKREAGGAGLRLDDRRRSVFAGEIAVDRICLEAISQFSQQLFRPLRVGVVATERASTVIWYLNQVRCAPTTYLRREIRNLSVNSWSIH
jgi:hypothetical protein